MRRLIAAAVAVVAFVALTGVANANRSYDYDASGVKRAATVAVWCEQPTTWGQQQLWYSGPLPLAGSFTPFVGGSTYTYPNPGPYIGPVVCTVWALTKGNRVAAKVSEVTL